MSIPIVHEQPMGGGFIIHDALGFRPGLAKGRVSAWVNAQGTLTDAEQLTASGQIRPVKKGGPLWWKIAQEVRYVWTAYSRDGELR